MNTLCRWLLALCLCGSHLALAEENEPPEESKTAKTRAAKSRLKTHPTSGSLADDGEPPAPPPVRISRSRQKADATPAEAGWAALAAGDLHKARSEFERALKHTPRAGDALIGLAHLAAYQKQTALAASYVQRAIEAHPRNADAQALALLFAGSADPLGQESAARNLIATDPANAGAHFALALVLARGVRWKEAQDAFFSAWSIEPDNADYQYNLAVSLDHLNQPRLALDHYKSALLAASRRAAAFDAAAARKRIDTLEAQAAAQPKE